MEYKRFWELDAVMYWALDSGRKSLAFNTSTWLRIASSFIKFTLSYYEFNPFNLVLKFTF